MLLVLVLVLPELLLLEPLLLEPPLLEPPLLVLGVLGAGLTVLPGAGGGEPLPLLPDAIAELATSNMETTVSPSTSNINVFLLISTSLPRCKNCL